MTQASSPPPKKPFVIAIDGPAASGKGTLARSLAAQYDLDYLDTGALYRLVAYESLERNKKEAPDVMTTKDYDDQSAIDVAHDLSALPMIDKEALNHPDLRSEHVAIAASRCSAKPEVRHYLLEVQRNFVKNTPRKGVVLDGRDIGTVVFPEADVKIFLTASDQKRASCRQKELHSKGIMITYDVVLKDMQERDERDTSRAIAPLTPAQDAFVIDSTDLDAQGSFTLACRYVDAKWPFPKKA